MVDKPLIQYAVEEAYAAGVREMIFVTGRHKRPIEDHFDMTFELEVALEQAGKQELLDVVRSVKPDDMECIYVRQAQALGLGHAVLCGQRLVGNEPVRGAAGRRPDGRRAAGAEADGRAVRRVARVDPGGAGSAGRAHPALRHRGRHAGQRPPGRRHPHRREAGARRRAVAAGRGRPLHPDAGRVPRDRQPAARRRRRDPAHRRHRRRCCGARRCSPTATKASATTAAARKASCRPTSSWRSRTPSSGRASATT